MRCGAAVAYRSGDRARTALIARRDELIGRFRRCGKFRTRPSRNSGQVRRGIVQGPESRNRRALLAHDPAAAEQAAQSMLGLTICEPRLPQLRSMASFRGIHFPSTRDVRSPPSTGGAGPRPAESDA